MRKKIYIEEILSLIAFIAGVVMLFMALSGCSKKPLAQPKNQPCYDSYIVAGQSTTEYDCYWYTVIDTYKIEICGKDTTILNCFNSVKITPKPCYYNQK